MMSEVSFSAARYLQMRHLLTPKHLELAPARRKQQQRDKYLLQPPKLTFQQDKKRFMKPMADIEKIMRHFDAKFRDGQAGEKVKPRHKRTSSSLAAFQNPSDKKMEELLNLPSLQVIKRRAQSFRTALDGEQAAERMERRQRIVDQFQDYLKAELKVNCFSNESRFRLKTTT